MYMLCLKKEDTNQLFLIKIHLEALQERIIKKLYKTLICLIFHMTHTTIIFKDLPLKFPKS